MTPLRRLLLPLCLLTLTATAALSLPQPTSTPPAADVLAAINKSADLLAKKLAALRAQGVRDHLLADIEIYHKAATWIVRHDEFYQKDSAERTLAVLDRGHLRLSQLARGDSPWLAQTGRSVVRAYRSAVDGSLQPYAVTLPA